MHRLFRAREAGARRVSRHTHLPWRYSDYEATVPRMGTSNSPQRVTTVNVSSAPQPGFPCVRVRRSPSSRSDGLLYCIFFKFFLHLPPPRGLSRFRSMMDGKTVELA